MTTKPSGVYVVGREGSLEVYRDPPKREQIRGADGSFVYERWTFQKGPHRVGFVARNDSLDESQVKTLLIRQITEQDAKVLAEHDSEVERAREVLKGLMKSRQSFMAVAARRGERVRVPT